MSDAPFHPELFDERTRLHEALEAGGYVWFTDYGSIDPDHENFGLMVAGIGDLERAVGIAEILQQTFPDWPSGGLVEREWWSREPGWVVTITREGETSLEDEVLRWQQKVQNPGEAPAPAREDVSVLTYAGELDDLNVGEFSGQVDGLLREGLVNIALDLSGLTYVGSRALGYLIQTKKRAEEHGGDLVIVRPSEFLRKALKVLGIGEYFRLFDTVESAIRAFADQVSPVQRREEEIAPGMVLFGLLDRPQGGGVIHGAGRIEHLDARGLTFDWRVPSPLEDDAARGLDASNFELRVRPGVRMRLKIRHGERFVEAEGVVESITQAPPDEEGRVTIRVRPDESG